MDTLYMELSIKDFYIDLFSSFRYNKEHIDDQISRDFERLHFYFQHRPITTKNQFYAILKSIDLSPLYKRLLWIVPNQATLFPFYQHLTTKYRPRGWIVAEIADGDHNATNKFNISVSIISYRRPRVEITKNFRLLQNLDGGRIATVGYVYLKIQYTLGIDSHLQINMCEDLKLSHIE